MCSIIWKYLSSTYCVSYTFPVIKDPLMKVQKPWSDKGDTLKEIILVLLKYNNNYAPNISRRVKKKS